MADVFSNLGPPPIPSEPVQVPLVGRNNAFAQIAAIHLDDLKCWREKMDQSQELVRLVASAKNCLVAAEGQISGCADILPCAEAWGWEFDGQGRLRELALVPVGEWK